MVKKSAKKLSLHLERTPVRKKHINKAGQGRQATDTALFFLTFSVRGDPIQVVTCSHHLSSAFL